MSMANEEEKKQSIIKRFSLFYIREVRKILS